MPAGRYFEVIETAAVGRWSPAALVLCAVLLPGCGAAVWEDARSETGRGRA